jgi:hypothetical protein
MLSRMMRGSRNTLALACSLIASAPCSLAADAKSDHAYAIRLLGSDACGATAVLTSTYLRSPGLEDRLRKIGVRPHQVRPPGITATPTPIPEEVMQAGAMYYSLQAQDEAFAPTTATEKLAFKDPSSALVAPYVFFDLGNVGVLTYQNFNKTNGRVALPPGFGLRLRRSSNRWEYSGDLGFQDVPDFLSCLGAALESHTTPTASAPDSVTLSYEDGEFLPDASTREQHPPLTITIRGMRVFEGRGRTGTFSEAVSSLDPAPDLTGWLQGLSALLRDAEMSKAVRWVDNGAAMPSPSAAEATKSWEQLPYVSDLSATPVFVRAILPAKPVSVVRFQSASNTTGLFLYVLNDADGKPFALVDPQAAKLEPRFALFECAAQHAISMDPAASAP